MVVQEISFDLLSAGDYDWPKEDIELLIGPLFDCLGSLSGKKVLDIGCGPGWITEMIAKEAAYTKGIDKSCTMICKAMQARVNAYYEIADIVEHSDGIYDTITSTLTMQLITPEKNFKKAIANCREMLHDEGDMILLLPHPCFIDRRDTGYSKYLVDDFTYFSGVTYEAQLRTRKGWISFASHSYSLESYVRMFKSEGFYLDDLIEPEGWADERYYPNFLILRCKKR